MLPDAFRYEYLGTQNGLVELAFTPNPEFHSASREGQVFHNMAGRIWIDSSQKRLAHIQGRLINEVKFGGGLLGHLDAGGTFLVEQQQVGPHSWEVNRVHIEMLGKALFFKLIQLRQDDRNFDFEPVPNNLTLRGAAQLLRDSTTRVAEAARNMD